MASLKEYARHLTISQAPDLMAAALRFANLEGFDLAEALCERVAEKNGGADFGAISGTAMRLETVRR